MALGVIPDLSSKTNRMKVLSMKREWWVGEMVGVRERK
jgi:hypothetical protein